MLPVRTVTTAAPATSSPLTKGPNAGPFWWVFTQNPGPVLPVSFNTISRTTTIQPTTTEIPGELSETALTEI